MESENELKPIDLFRYFNRFLKLLRWTWLPILILSLLYGSYNHYRASRSFTPEYQSKAILAVKSGTYENDIFNTSTYYDSAAADNVVSTFPTLLSTDFMQDLIKAELGTTYIPGSISVSSIAETNMFELFATGSDPQVLCDVLWAVINAYPKASVYMTDNSNIQLIEEPSTPISPINSFSGTGNLVSSMGKVIIAGLALTFVLSLLNQAVCSEEELKEMVSIPILACLPQIRVKKRRRTSEVLIRAADDPGMSEAIRGLRTKVRKKLDDEGSKVVLLTSTTPGEGKTTAATNLAIALAAEGHKTVLLDADLRNQTIGRLMNADHQAPGLTALLKNPEMPVSQCLKASPEPNLSYISGASIQKRYYRIDPKALKRVLHELSQQFDYVVIDTPPCGVVSDTTLLSRYADCVLYVVRQDYANKAHITDTILGLHQQNVPLAGCILNGTPRSHRSYGYGYGRGYGYGKKYGYGTKYGYGRKSGE